MEIKQRKNCGSCRCYSRISLNCQLGYNVKYGKKLLGIIIDCIPMEPCPKPLTVSDCVEAFKNYRK